MKVDLEPIGACTLLKRVISCGGEKLLLDEYWNFDWFESYDEKDGAENGDQRSLLFKWVKGIIDKGVLNLMWLAPLLIWVMWFTLKDI